MRFYEHWFFVDPLPVPQSARVQRGRVRMMTSLVPGVSGKSALAVRRDRPIGFMGDKARVYAARMLWFDREVACRELMLEHLNPGEDSVGTRIELDHIVPALLGMPVELEVKVVYVKEHALTLELEGHDGVLVKTPAEVPLSRRKAVRVRDLRPKG
jgi:predicted thioesterase